MKKIWHLSVFLALVILFACATNNNQEQTHPTDPGTSEGEKVTLALFGAPWCDHCKTQFPEINSLLKDELGKRGRLTAVLYVTTGKTAGQKPTQAVADGYRDELKLSFDAKTDESWKNYRAWVQNDRKLPAAVVLNEKGEVIKVFPPGATTFVPQEIASFIKEKTK